jgi:hypothetical protein
MKRTFDDRVWDENKLAFVRVSTDNAINEVNFIFFELDMGLYAFAWWAN